MIMAFFLGGTISMSGTSAAVARLGGQDLVASIPGLDLEVEVDDFRRMPSASFTFADMLELLAAVRTACDRGADGAVIVQGTDTIDETAFLLDLLWDGPQPVVVTGAMRTAAMAGPDGPANLLAALRVAAAPAARGLGVLVVLNDEIHAARWVVKRHTISASTFESPNAGPLGRLVEDVPTFTTAVARRPPVRVAGPLTARVPVLPVALGDDGSSVGRLAGHCDGLVVAAFGAGHVPESWIEPLTDLAARVPVVLTSRIGAGPVLTHTYGAPGSETDLLARGLIHGGWLTSYQARLVLITLLARDEPGGTESVAAGFAPYR